MHLVTTKCFEYHHLSPKPKVPSGGTLWTAENPPDRWELSTLELQCSKITTNLSLYPIITPQPPENLAALPSCKGSPLPARVERADPCSVGAASTLALSFSCSVRAEGQPGGVITTMCKTYIKAEPVSMYMCIRTVCMHAGISAQRWFSKKDCSVTRILFLKDKPLFFSNLTAVSVPPGDVTEIIWDTSLGPNTLTSHVPTLPALLQWWKQTSWMKYQTWIYRGYCHGITKCKFHILKTLSSIPSH